jgi:hypothetical protein
MIRVGLSQMDTIRATGREKIREEGHIMGAQLATRIHHFLTIKLEKYPDCEDAAQEILEELRR